MKHRHDKVQRRSQRVRTVFLSDTYLGCQYSRTEALLEFLNHFEPDHLYLVGDIIDGWQLRQSWYWDENCTALVEHFSGALRLVHYPSDLSKAFQESDDNLKLTGSTPHIAESAWRNHGEDLLQPVGGGTRTCDPSANHGGGLEEPT